MVFLLECSTFREAYLNAAELPHTIRLYCGDHALFQDQGKLMTVVNLVVG